MNRIKKNKKIHNTAVLVRVLQYRLILIFFFTFLALLSLYIYFLATAIFSTVSYKQYKVQIGALNSRVADLETQFLKQTEQLNILSAKEYDLVVISNKKFVNRTIHIGRAD